MDEDERSGLDSFLDRKRARRAARQTAVIAALDRLQKLDLTRRLADMTKPPQAMRAQQPEPASEPQAAEA